MKNQEIVGDPSDQLVSGNGDTNTKSKLPILIKRYDLGEAFVQSKLLSEQSVAPYWELCMALTRENWEFVKDFIDKDPKVLNTRISETSDNVFHFISWSKDDVAIELLEKYAPKFEESLVLENASDDTPLSIAATTNNLKALQIMVNLNKELPNKRTTDKCLPIHTAAVLGNRETVQFLLPITRLEKSIYRFDGVDDGVFLLELLVESELFGVALDLLKHHANFAPADLRNLERGKVLKCLANKPSGFASCNRLQCWERLIYNWIPVKEKLISSPNSKNNDFPVHKSPADMESPLRDQKVAWKNPSRPHFMEKFVNCAQICIFCSGMALCG